MIYTGGDSQEKYFETFLALSKISGSPRSNSRRDLGN
jgi:hypothetical protein